MIQRNTEFDPLAWGYNRHWGVAYHAQAFPVVARLLLSRLAAGASILDVCCGTGKFTEQVRERGFTLCGLDASEEMIRHARENAPGVRLVVADVREFSLHQKFDAAYSIYESLNHVPDLQGLRAAFTCIRKHLDPGSPFLFDLNGEEAYIQHWNNTDAIVEPDNVWIMRSHFDDETGVAICQVTSFRQDKTWTRSDFEVSQTYHDFDGVYEALLDAGFSDASLYSARDVGMIGEGFEGRTFFLASA